MFRKIKIISKWSWRRWKLKFNKTYNNSRPLKTDEQLIKNVVIKIASNPESTILIYPLSEIIYAQTKDKQYAIVLGKESIKISNHQFFIESHLEEFFSKELFNIVYRYVEKSRTGLDKEIFKNQVDGLNFMLNKLK